MRRREIYELRDATQVLHLQEVLLRVPPLLLLAVPRVRDIQLYEAIVSRKRRFERLRGSGHRSARENWYDLNLQICCSN